MGRAVPFSTIISPHNAHCTARDRFMNPQLGHGTLGLFVRLISSGGNRIFYRRSTFTGARSTSGIEKNSSCLKPNMLATMFDGNISHLVFSSMTESL